MTQFEFDKLLEKYLAGDCTVSESKMVEQWAEHQEGYTNPFPLTPSEEVDISKRLKKRIDANTVRMKPNFLKFSFFRLGLIACILSAVSVCGWFLLKNNFARTTNKTAGFELVNTTNAEQAFKLKDGSSIILKPQSKLTYLENFGVGNRTVFLKGEGYFQVVHDTSKPFLVYAGNLVTKVVGTTFTVKAFENDKKAEVIVTSGKVLVYENQNGKFSKPVVLTPNQKVDYAKKSDILKPQLVDNPIVINPISKAEDFIFEKTTLSAVLNKLKKVYSIDIFFKNKTLENCQFTGNLNDLTLYEQLDLICKSVDANYQKYETAIWISGEGCN